MQSTLKLLKRHPILLGITITILILSMILTLSWNFLLSRIITSVSTGTIPSLSLLLQAMLLIILSCSIQYLLTILCGWTSENLTHELRMSYARHFLHMDLIDLEQMNTGEQMSCLQNELTEISDYLTNQLFLLIQQVIRFLFTFIWLITLNPLLAILPNLPVFLILIYVGYSSKIIGALTKQSQEAKQKLNGVADTLIFLFPMVKIYDASKMMLSNYKFRLQQWETASIREEHKRALLMSFSGLLSCIPRTILLLLGGIKVIQGSLDLGILYIFINLSGNVSGVLMNMPGNIAAFRHFSSNMKQMEPNLSYEERRLPHADLCQ